MGPFMVEIVFCRVTRRGRKLKKGMNKAGLANTRNDGPSQSFIPPDDTVKITLDLSENGPVFNALDEMMMKMLEDESDTKKTKKKGGGSAGPGGAEAKKALKSLLKSGIPGIEKMFAPAGKGKKGSAKGFHRMNEGSKKKFMKAIFGEDGTAISTGTAAALIAATCSGGDPEVGDKIAQLLVPELGNKIDPTMMAALMISCSMISAGAGMEEVLKAMKAELLDSGMPEEEIFRKTQLLMQAFGRDESGSLAEYSLVGKQKNSALKKISISPKDFSQIALLQRTLGACGATPENLAKVIMIQNQLSKRGAQSRHIADALRKLTDPNKGKKDTIDLLSKSLNDPKMKKEDVQITVRMMQAIDMENDATWKEVKSMKEILTGASPTSPEAIELNLARATKAAGLNRGELTRVLLAQRTMSTLGVDPTLLSQVLNIEKVIADNGVPAVEIARVLTDGGVPKEAHAKLVEMTLAGLQKEYCAADVEAFIKLYDGLKLKSNVPEETIEHIDKTLIQVRCSLEDVADNTVSSMCARGEKDSVIVRNLCETLKDTGASVQIVGTTMMGSLVKVLPKPEPEIMKDTGRTLTEVGYNTDDVNSTMTEILLNVLDEKPQLREEALKAVEVVMKDSGQFPDQIRTYLDSVVPEEVPMDAQLAEELERLRKADARGDGGDGAESDGEPEYDEQGRVIPKIIEPRNRGQGHMDSGSRRGSNVGTSPRGSISIGGTERRGSFYSEDVSKRDSVAIVVDDPHNQNNMKKALDEVFEEGDGTGNLDGMDEDDLFDLDPEKVDEMVTAIKSSGMSEAEIKKLMGVFKLDGKIHHIGGVSKFRSANNMKDIIMDTEDMFDKALNDAEAQRLAIQKIGVSSDTRKLMEKILATQKKSADVSERVSNLLASSGLTTSRGVDYRKRDDIDRVEYTSIKDTSVRRSNRRFDMPDIEPEETYRHPASLGIGVIGTGNQRLVRRNVHRATRFKALEESRESSVDEDRRILGLRRAKVPLMVYSCGGFTRCYRLARFYSVDGPPIGLKYRDNPTSGL
eukprot:TRINITY_DN316_c0_g2_i1.p2 TRINITY_DN316_c0_g2~~TRINITY_DN316_c0_g2_i1.p2  ORF type:complete len:1031 (-),score=293.92 TRINITY_DN316_c0_g2_i1:292-3384(-)